MPESKKPQQPERQIMIKNDLDYLYRDMFQIFVGPEDVLLEFGNHHRSVANQSVISNRIVLSVNSAVKLHQALGGALGKMREQMQSIQPVTKESTQ